MNIVIVKYNAGNIQSVLFALERLGVHAVVTNDKETIQSADKIIFPGVGEANSAMQYLKEKNIDQLIKNVTQPLLGICLGMQLLCSYSEENDTECIGVFNNQVKKFDNTIEKVPQIGWNTITPKESNLFKNIDTEAYCYFVHSYYATLNEQTIATTHYINEFSSALQYKNFYGVQFHPEKSAKVGEQILKNFIEI